MRFKTGIINRIRLFFWFQLMAIWSIISPKTGQKIVLAWIRSENEINRDNLG